MERFNLQELIHEAISSFEPLAKKKSIQLKCVTQDKCYVWNNPNIVKLVLTNLIANAIKFTNSGFGIEITYETRETMAIVYVKDSGIGMSERTRKEILMGGNYKLSQGTKGEKGAGLGLKLSKEFIELTGGSFFIESELNKGSTFSFTIKLDNK